MMIDQPVIDYKSDTKSGFGNTRKDKEEADALADAWAARKAERGSMAGKTFSLEGFIKGEV